MDTKINFFKIGLFVIALVTSLLILVFWLGKFGFEKKKFDEYSILILGDSKRYNHTFSLVLIDLNKFKIIHLHNFSCIS